MEGDRFEIRNIACNAINRNDDYKKEAFECAFDIGQTYIPLLSFTFNGSILVTDISNLFIIYGNFKPAKNS